MGIDSVHIKALLSSYYKYYSINCGLNGKIILKTHLMFYIQLNLKPNKKNVTHYYFTSFFMVVHRVIVLFSRADL